MLPGRLNKRHWNTVIIDGSLPDQLIKDMIEDSYDLAVSSVPQYARKRGACPSARPPGKNQISLGRAPG